MDEEKQLGNGDNNGGELVYNDGADNGAVKATLSTAMEDDIEEEEITEDEEIEEFDEETEEFEEETEEFEEIEEETEEIYEDFYDAESVGFEADEKGVPGNFFRKYLLTVGATVGALVVLSSLLVFVYSMSKQKDAGNDNITAPNPVVTAVPGDLNGEGDTDDFAAPTATHTPPPQNGGLFDLPRKTFFLIMGMDEGGFLADVDIVACYDSVTQEFNLVSIPRDTKIRVAADDLAELRKHSGIPSDGVIKFNELHSYAGKKEGHNYLAKYAGQMLAADIDYFVRIDLKAFRYIVDAVGGVWMNVRPGGYEYEDEYQDLVISVPGGYQLLDGRNAEGVVRYREDYRLGDTDRIKVQQQFMKEFFKQVLSTEAIVKNPFAYFTMIKDYVDTDFGADELILYADAFAHMDPEKINFYTLPGEGVEEYRYGQKVSYYIYWAKDALELAADIFNDYSAPEETAAPNTQPTDEPVAPDLKTLKIQVLNGGDIEGKAASVRDRLRGDGYTVTGIGNYAGAQHDETRIMTRFAIDVAPIADMFENASVRVDTAIDEQFDIIIIIGTGEK